MSKMPTREELERQLRANREAMQERAMASKIIGGREADDAVLEWFNNRVDYGPDYNLVPNKTMTNWELYCQTKGNCPHEQFDKSLLEAFGYLEYRLKGEFGALLIDFPEGCAR